MKPTAALFLVLLLAGCGGTAGAPAPVAPTPAAPTPPAPPPPAPTGGSGGGGGSGSGSGSTAPISQSTVNVGAGATASNTNIAVVPPIASPAPNAQDLGVTVSGRGSAYNTGDVIHRGATARVLLFGPGLDGSMQVQIDGPGGIDVSGITSIQSTDNTPGISFTATVASDAPLGARTVLLKNSQGDITAFTGGLEVVQ